MPKPQIKYYPVAARCRTCTRQHNDCRSLPFDQMPVHRRDGCDVSVICSEFDRFGDEPSTRRPMPPGRYEQIAKAQAARDAAEAACHLKYLGHDCDKCGTRARYTKTGRCVECIRLTGHARRSSNQQG